MMTQIGLPSPGPGWLLVAQLTLALAIVVVVVHLGPGSTSAQPAGFLETAVFPLAAANVSDPFKIAVGGPGEAWFTLPAEGALGRLTVMSTNVYTFDIFHLPAADGEPYDLVYTAESVWLTERAGNRLTEFDLDSQTFTGYALPNPDSAPSGIAEAPDGTIWFAEQNGDRIGSLDPDDPGPSLTEYQYTAFPGNEFEDISVAPDGIVWVTAPARNRVFEFITAVGFLPRVVSELPGTQPYAPQALVTGNDSRPWISVPDFGRLATFIVGTLFFWEWIVPPHFAAAPADIDHLRLPQGDGVWYLDETRARVTRLVVDGRAQVRGISVFDIDEVGSQPRSVAVDNFGMAWIADPGADAILTWAPLQLDERAYLPLTKR